MNGKYQGEPQRTSVVLPYSRIAEILHLFRFRYVLECPPAPAPKPVCRQFSRCEGCPYPSMAFSAGAVRMTVCAHGWKKFMKGTVTMWIKAAPSNGRRPD